jgi:anti-sigma regulatory factor (Ser/Thr protein kinase)
VLRGWGVTGETLIDRVELVISELVSNTVRHADGPGALELSLEDGCVTVAVVDSSPDRPVPRSTADDVGGRGLPIIEAISTRWGSHPSTGGKRVWAQFDREADPLSP